MLTTERRPPDAYIKATALSLASRFLGVHEVDGPDAHPVILAMLQACARWISDDDTAWCGAFVNAIAHLLELPRPRNPLGARQWLTVGAPVPLERAIPGFDVVVMWRGSTPQPGPEVIGAPGHVGFFAGRDSNGNVLVLGGNQGDEVSIAAYPASRVLGIRRL